jgi:hypothetical protein
MGLFFYPRGGSARVAGYLSRALGQEGWPVTLARGSLGAKAPVHRWTIKIERAPGSQHLPALPPFEGQGYPLRPTTLGVMTTA